MIFSSVEAEFNFLQLENISDPLEAQKTDVDAEIRAKKIEKRFMAGPGIEPRTLCVIGQRSPTLLQSQITNQGFKTHINVYWRLGRGFSAP